MRAQAGRPQPQWKHCLARAQTADQSRPPPLSLDNRCFTSSSKSSSSSSNGRLRAGCGGGAPPCACATAGKSQSACAWMKVTDAVQAAHRLHCGTSSGAHPCGLVLLHICLIFHRRVPPAGGRQGELNKQRRNLLMFSSCKTWNHAEGQGLRVGRQEAHHTGPPNRPSPDAQLMQPTCTSGVRRCCPARFDSGTLQWLVVPKLWLPCGGTSGNLEPLCKLCWHYEHHQLRAMGRTARCMAWRRRESILSQWQLAVRAQSMAHLLHGEHGAQDLISGLSPLRDERPVCNLLPHKVVK